MNTLPRYDRRQTYDWNFTHAPDPIVVDAPIMPGEWRFCGLPVDSPLGVPAGPLLNGRWCLYYASLGFDVLTYKTVRSVERACFPLPNLQPVKFGQLFGGESDLPATDDAEGTWAVAFGMPSQSPAFWRPDIESLRRQLPARKLLVVSVVGSVQPDWTLDDLARDYADCARWAVESGADCVEANFSCPNVSTCDGQLYQSPSDSAVVAAAIRAAIGATPFIVKIGRLLEPEAADALLVALAPHVTALATTNSIAATVLGPDGHQLYDGQKRGICGDGIRVASMDQVRMFRRLIDARGLKTELIGVGGASTAAHVREYLSAGASAVQLATAAMLHPGVALDIRREWANQPRRLLVLCTGNSCRSQMAEGLWRTIGRGEWEVYSAGSQPAGYVHPLAVRVMSELGIDISRNESKHVERFRNQPFDLVVTVCDHAAQSCPVFSGARQTLHWPFPDPAHATGTDEERLNEFRAIRDQIAVRFQEHLASR